MPIVGRLRHWTRYVLKWAWIYLLYFSGGLRWARRKIVARSGVIVLTLHRVLPRPEFENTPSPRGMVIDVETFEQLLEFLKRYCDILDLSGDGPDWHFRGKRPRVALTFDDGWKDTFEVAVPLLEKYKIPATVFVCPNLAGSPSPFWAEQVSRAWRAAAGDLESSKRFSDRCRKFLPERDFSPAQNTNNAVEGLTSSIKDLPADRRKSLIAQLGRFVAGSPLGLERFPLESTMTWDEVKTIQSKGTLIGSHTQNHEILTRLPSDEAHREIADSKAVLESTLRRACHAFAYPNGTWSPEIRDLVKQSGYKIAFINTPGIWTRETDPWLIPRHNIWQGSLSNLSNAFSPIMFQYSVFWRAYGSAKKHQNDTNPRFRR